MFHHCFFSDFDLVYRFSSSPSLLFAFASFYFYFSMGFYFDFDLLLNTSSSFFPASNYLTSFSVRTRDSGLPFGPILAPMEINLGTFLCFRASNSKLGLYSISCFRMLRLNYYFTFERYFSSPMSFTFQDLIRS